MAIGRKGGQSVGFSWSDVASAGQTAFPYIHAAGSGVLSAFGAGALVAPVTSLEQRGGLLPSATTSSPNAQHADRVVQKADYVILVPKDGSKQPTVIASPDLVGIYNGRKFDGNGYAGPSDLGQKFSFGYDAPTSVDVVAKGQQQTFKDVKQALLCGGVETKSGPTNIAGDVMSKKGIGIVTTILGILGLTDDDDGEYAIGALPSVPTNRYLRGTIAQASKSTLKGLPSSFGFQTKTSAKGRKFMSLVVNRQKNKDPKKTIQAARAVAKRAQQTANAVLARVDKAKKVVAQKAATHIVGLFGKPPISPKTAQSLIALEDQAHRLLDAGQKLAAHADKYEKVVHNNEAKKAAAAVQAQRVTHIHGMGEYFTDIVGATWDEILGAEWNEIISDEVDYINDIAEILGDMAPIPTGGAIDPTTGLPIDPTTGLPIGTGIDPTTGLPIGTGGTSSSVPGPPDFGAGTPPAISGGVINMPDGTQWPAPGEDYMPDPYPNGDDPTFYDCPTDDDLPLGAVVFDGSRVPDFQGLGNYTIFFGTLPGAAPPKGGPNSGYEWHGSGGFDWALVLQGTQPSTGYSGGKNYDKVDQPSYAMVTESQKNNWGPLIGNPNGTWTQGLRFSPSGPNGPRWFWFYDTAARVAPWAVQNLLQAHLNDAITQYKAAVVAGQTDYVNAQLQDKLNAQQAAQAAQQQAAVDAQVAQQQEVADTQAAIQDQQLQQQYEQQQLQQQAFSQQQAQQQAQLEAQAQQMQLQYFQQHPDAMFVPADDGSQQQAPAADGGYQFGPAPDYGQDVDTENGINWGADQFAQQGGGDGRPSATDLVDEADSLFTA